MFGADLYKILLSLKGMIDHPDAKTELFQSTQILQNKHGGRTKTGLWKIDSLWISLEPCNL